MRILISIIAILFTASYSQSQINFFKLFSNSGDDIGEGIVQLEDSSYVITGSSGSFVAQGGQAFLLHIDSVGNYIWSNHYGGAESDGGRRVMYNPDLGYYVAGYTNSMGAGGYDMYLFKTDLNGNLEWEKTFGGAGWERTHDVAFASDSGLIIVGETSSNPTEDVDAYIVRTDKNGDTLWTKTIGSLGGKDLIEAIAPLNDSVFYCAGRIWIQDSSMYKAYVMRLHENGTVEFSDTLGPNGNYAFHELDIELFNSQRIVLVGHNTGGTATETDEYYARLNLDGSFQFEYTVTSNGFREARAITHYGTPFKYYGCFENLDQWSHQDGVDVTILKMNNAAMWESNAFSVGYPLPDHMGEFIPTSDGGAICVGETNSEGWEVGINHVFVAKIGPGDVYPSMLTPHDIGDLVNTYEMPEITGIRIYPNPTNDELNIELESGAKMDVRIIDLTGNEVASKVANGSMKFSINYLQAGIYLVEVVSEGKSGVQRIVVN